MVLILLITHCRQPSLYTTAYSIVLHSALLPRASPAQATIRYRRLLERHSLYYADNQQYACGDSKASARWLALSVYAPTMRFTVMSTATHWLSARYTRLVYVIAPTPPATSRLNCRCRRAQKPGVTLGLPSSECFIVLFSQPIGKYYAWNKHIVRCYSRWQNFY